MNRPLESDKRHPIGGKVMRRKKQTQKYRVWKETKLQGLAAEKRKALLC